MKRFVSGLLIMIFALATLQGCYTMKHTVGDGAKGNVTEEARQWYVLWGLVPINTVDSKEMARGARDYTVTTQMAPLDVLINIFTTYVTIVSRTVTVQR